LLLGRRGEERRGEERRLSDKNIIFYCVSFCREWQVENLTEVGLLAATHPIMGARA
jgi:hypothetical protein